MVKNDKVRIYAKCEGKGCQWRVHCHKVKDGTGFQVHTYMPHHECVLTQIVHYVKSSWLASRFLHKFKIDPDRNIKAFVLEVKNETGMVISTYQAYRARKLSLSILEGPPDAQYAKLWYYAEELRSRNPGSTVIVGVDRVTHEVTHEFRHFYICFNLNHLKKV